MAKAVFHKHQRVFVRPVGTWALIERVKPQWVKDIEEPVRIYYDCGLGRDFVTDELSAEAMDQTDPGNWRVMRAHNKWQTPEECAHHPQPGTYPVVVTDTQNWGGWRVPGAEYDRDPNRIEQQARLISQGPRLLAIAEALARLAAEDTDASPEWMALARRARDVVRSVKARPQSNSEVASAAE